jgi:hypothetical protein
MTLPLPLPVNGMEAARGRPEVSQPPQLGRDTTATIAAEQGTGGYLGVSMGGTSRAPFRATGTEQDDTIPLGSFLTAEAATRVYDRRAAATPGRALNLSACYEGGSALDSYQRTALATRPGTHAHGGHGLPQQRDGNGDDNPEQLTDSDWSDGDDDGHGMTSIERAARDCAQRKAPAAGIARGSLTDCAQYVGVTFVERKKAAPFQAQIRFKSKNHHICRCPTAEAAARAYDVVACMIPGRPLNFPTTIPAAASSSQQREGASAVPAESDILAAIAALRQAQPQLAPWGTAQYFGVHINKGSTRNPYQARIRIDGKQKHLSSYPTAEAAARAYDAVARTIHGHKLNFPTGGSSVAAAAGDSCMGIRSLPARGAGKLSQPPRVADNDDGSHATAAAARARKRKQPSSSSLLHAIAKPQQLSRQKTHASAAQVHHPVQPSQQLRDPDAHAEDQPARRSILELFIAGIDEDGEPLNGPSQLGVPDLTVAEILAVTMRP